jgi:hypothetical protein
VTDLSLSTVASAMVDSAKSWDAVASFCEHVYAAEGGGRAEQGGRPSRSPEPQAAAGPEAQISGPDGAALTVRAANGMKLQCLCPPQ